MRRMGASRQPLPDANGRRRPLARVLGAFVLLAVGVAGGAVLGRLTAPASTPSQPGQSATAGVPGVGPREVVRGIAVGYEHSPRGAAQAAGNYLATLGGQTDRAKISAALQQVAEPSSRQRLESALEASLQAEEGLWGIQAASRQGQRALITQTPIAYKVDTYTPDEATVRVWLVTNIGVADRQRLAAFFGISSATLVWLNGDWRLRTTGAGSQAGDVIPACLQTPTPAGGVPSMLDGFVPYGT